MIVWDKKEPWPPKYADAVKNIEQTVRKVLSGELSSYSHEDLLVYPTAGGVTMTKAAAIALLDKPEPVKKPKKDWGKSH